MIKRQKIALFFTEICCYTPGVIILQVKDSVFLLGQRDIESTVVISAENLSYIYSPVPNKIGGYIFFGGGRHNKLGGIEIIRSITRENVIVMDDFWKTVKDEFKTWKHCMQFYSVKLTLRYCT